MHKSDEKLTEPTMADAMRVLIGLSSFEKLDCAQP
jgi:hypothetical protein